MTDPSPGSAGPRSVVILGAGTMGVGIGLTFARAGARVSLTSRRQSTLDQAGRHLEERLTFMARHRLIPDVAVEEVPALISRLPFDELNFEVDLVIESIAEDAEAKVDILRRAESQASDETIIATNTSSLTLRELSSSLERPQRFAGYHWFNPPELVALVEVIPGPSTDPRTLDTLADWASGVGKQPVVMSREIEGFIANRLQYSLMREAYTLVQDGVCSLRDVDRVMRACLGPRWAGVGPFEAMDLAGLDVHLEVARRLFPLLSNRAEPPSQLEQLVERGALGTKSGQGLHGNYDEARIIAAEERRASALVALSALEGQGAEAH